MAGVPAVCDNGHRYEDHNISLGPGSSSITFIGTRVGPCPACGAMASVVDGTYDVVRGVTVRRAVTAAVKGLTHPNLSPEDLAVLRAELERARSSSRSAAQLKADVEGKLPAASGLLNWLQSPAGLATAVWLTLLINLIGMILAFKATSASPSPTEMETIIEKAIETTAASSSNPDHSVSPTSSPVKPVVPRSAPLACPWP